LKPDRSRNDWIALALVAVLAFLLALITAATLSGHPLGEEAWVTAAAIVGAIAGYLTAGRSHQTPAPAEQISTGEDPSGLDQTPPAPDTPPAADEHFPGSETSPPLSDGDDSWDTDGEVSPFTSATEAMAGEGSALHADYDDVTSEFVTGLK
jgi:hypothetical protein